MITQYQGTVSITALHGKHPYTGEAESDYIMVELESLPGMPLPFLTAVANESKFVGWQVTVEGSSEPVMLETNKATSFNQNVEIQAVFADGVVPIYYYVPDPKSTTGDIMLGLLCLKEGDVEDEREAIEQRGGGVGLMPPDGDFSKTEEKQAP